MKRETPVVRAVRKMLKARGAWDMKVHGGMFTRAGLPDIVACLPGGWFVAFEVKRPGKHKAEKIQNHELAAIAAAGGIVGVVQSKEDAERLIDEAIRKRGAA